MATPTSNGNCFICGKTAGKIAIKNHVLKEHNDGDDLCYLIKAEGAYRKDFWLLFTVPLDATLADIDTFLRVIWCECCGHRSAFKRKGNEFAKSRRMSVFSVGDTLHYEYDFGSTTEILITFVHEILRPYQEEVVCLLARNEQPEEKCDECGGLATVVDVCEQKYLCDNCAEKVGEDVLLPLVNSPRAGECDYRGELDIWTFSPDGPFPQPGYD